MSGETLAHCFCQLPAPFTSIDTFSTFPEQRSETPGLLQVRNLLFKMCLAGTPMNQPLQGGTNLAQDVSPG